MTNIVERLGYHHEHPVHGKLVLINPDGPEAAAEIIRLTAEVERLRAALIKIEEIGFVRAKDAPAMHDEAIKLARAALTQEKSDEHA